MASMKEWFPVMARMLHMGTYGGCDCTHKIGSATVPAWAGEGLVRSHPCLRSY